VWSIGVLEYWSIGVLEYWSIGVLEYWSIGVWSGGVQRSHSGREMAECFKGASRFGFAPEKSGGGSHTSARHFENSDRYNPSARARTRSKDASPHSVSCDLI
jgi:hypothetical protein